MDSHLELQENEDELSLVGEPRSLLENHLESEHPTT